MLKVIGNKCSICVASLHWEQWSNTDFVTAFLEFFFQIFSMLIIGVITCKWHFLPKLVVRSTG
jgi:hypothetical protein